MAHQAAQSASARRQATYRRRHLHDAQTADAKRLNFLIPSEAKRTLERLAARDGVTQRLMIERLIAAHAGVAESRTETGTVEARQETRYLRRALDALTEIAELSELTVMTQPYRAKQIAAAARREIAADLQCMSEAV